MRRKFWPWPRTWISKSTPCTRLSRNTNLSRRRSSGLGGCEELVKCPGSWRSLRPFFAPFAVKGVDLAQGRRKTLNRKGRKDGRKERRERLSSWDQDVGDCIQPIFVG